VRRGVEHTTELGVHQWVVDRGISWLLRLGRLGLARVAAGVLVSPKYFAPQRS
jgi:hypothetical protein